MLPAENVEVDETIALCSVASKNPFKHKITVQSKESVASSSHRESETDPTSPIHPDVRATDAATLSLGLIKFLENKHGRDSMDQREIVDPNSSGPHFF